MSADASLVWGPTHGYLSSQIAARNRLRLLIAPFVQVDALSSLVNVCPDTSHLQVIARWAGPDILTGVADLAIYPYLKERRISLYLNDRIHLKLYVFDGSSAFHTSGNITQKGLGLSPHSNTEVGCLVRLHMRDWEQILRILQESLRVDDAVYEQALQYLGAHERQPHSAAQLQLRPTADKRFSILSLPASPSPTCLYDFYNAADDERHDEMTAASVHDLLLYQIPEGLEKEAFFTTLRARFRAHPFICAIVALIKEHQSARFGLVNAWLQQECSDKPTPYRWELKENTRTLYTWLEYFFEEISWDRPRYSMVIRWQASFHRGP